MFPAVLFNDPVVLLAVLVSVLPGDHPHAVLVKARVLWTAIGDVEIIDLTIYPVQLIFLVVKLGWLWAIITEPA